MRRDRFDRKVDHTVDTKGGTFGRVEVITGAGRRRSWSAEAKARIVMETLEAGAVVSDVARHHGIRPQQLFAWRNQMRTRCPAGTPAQLTFAPVAVEHATKPAERRAVKPGRASSAAASLIEIVIGTTLIRVSLPVDGEALATVLKAVKGAA
jgi:transposase